MNLNNCCVNFEARDKKVTNNEVTKNTGKMADVRELLEQLEQWGFEDLDQVFNSKYNVSIADVLYCSKNCVWFYHLAFGKLAQNYK